jgi:hypothetical protein
VKKEALECTVCTVGFDGRYKIKKDVPISLVELKAIEIATSFIFQQDE